VFHLHASFTDAYFEAMSGLTTTGATVFSSLDTLPPSINLWRGMLVWLGGMGLIVLAVAVLPLLGIGGRQMFKAETPGPMKDSSLTPRMAETAKGLWVVYGVVTVLCILSLRWAGMSWFDAVMHSFTTMGLGGFSSHDASFGHWNSPLIETVTVVFMLIAGMNFATLFLAVRGRSLLPYAHDPEARYFLGVTLASVIGIAIYLEVQGVYPDFGTAFRHALFNVVSIATTTGFASVDYNAWPIFAPLWMLFLCSFATSAGFHRRRHQDDQGDHPLQAGVSRAAARHASECGLAGARRRRRAAAEHPHRRAGLRLRLHVFPRRLDPADGLLRTRHPDRLHRRGGDREQYRTGAEPGRAGNHLRSADRLPDLGLQFRHAARPAGNLHPAGGADARLSGGADPL
jgi:hypothetical protein